MILKKLELMGFKTFADKTEIELGDGVTAIVGPNGSGKSNIADALMWVLGESNVRNLRGQRTTDVIFNGSEKRRAHGLAEVSLTLDNSARTLPLDFGEVTVTRRAYRSGEGEYFINKTRCRLKDIYELFLDTGIGSDAYSMVSQGEIDAVLSAKPEDRRELFEEAAGVKKYRYRREEALRKLDRTEQNLRRVCDIMTEIGSQVEPLALQAEKAKRFTELQSRLWDIEIGLLIKDLKRHSASLEQIRETRVQCASKLEECERRIARLERDKEEQTAKIAALEEEVENARRVQQSISGNLQRLEGKGALLEERLKSAAASRSKTESEITFAENKIEEFKQRLVSLDSQVEAEAQNESRARAESERRKQDVDDLDKRFEEASRSVSGRRADIIERANELAAKRGALQSARDRIAGLEATLEKSCQELTRLRVEETQAKARADEATEQIKVLGGKITESESKLSALRGSREALDAQIATLTTRLSGLSQEIAGRSSRLAALQEMAQAREGYEEGVRGVMEASAAGKLKGSFAIVADVIDAAKGYERAIETALGGSLQSIITGSIPEAVSAIAFLKSGEVGRATFLPLDAIRPPKSEIRGKMDPSAGALGLAADRVRCDSKYEPVLRLLLGRTVLADTIENAITLSKRLTGWERIVTLEGELIGPGGEMTGGSAKSKRPGLLIRKQEIESLESEIGHLAKSASDVEVEAEQASARKAEGDALIAAREKLLSEQRIALAEHGRRAEFAQDDLSRIARQIKAASDGVDETRAQLQTVSEDAQRIEEDLANAGSDGSDLDAEAAGAQEGFERLQRERDAERQELMRVNVELAGCTERAAALRNASADAQSSLDELQPSLASKQAQIKELSETEALLIGERDTVVRECATQRELLAAADKTLNDSVALRSAEVRRAAEIDGQLKEVAEARNLVAQEAHEAEVREARLEVQLNQATERLLTEYELTFEKAMEWPEEEIEVERGAVTEVGRLRREIKEMGTVNTGAIEEYERVRERWDFLTEQRGDLESAKEQINAAIGEIDANTRGLFLDTFNGVCANFDAVFKRLFGGGRTELSLTDPGNLLETGINVSVQPPGKKLQDLALLSGGERSLIAAALIFALLMVKPSPFVVLDEVDAALDESNVERFAEVLGEFAEKSQFIVITHNRATMEAANCLYGVTMDEPGISKLLSVRLAAEGPVEREVETALSG